MPNIFVFDVNGTLVPPGGAMAESMQLALRQLIAHHPVYLVSESSYKALQRQIPGNLLVGCNGVFGYSGSEFWRNGDPVFVLNHAFDHELQLLCQHFVDASPYPYRYGNHIMEFPGSMKVSVIGERASPKHVRDYLKWDKQLEGRQQLVRLIAKTLPQYEAVANDDGSVSIWPKGINKARILDEIVNVHPRRSITFLGDAMNAGGNDHSLARALRMRPGNHHLVPVHDWNDTLNHLNALLELGVDPTAA